MKRERLPNRRQSTTFEFENRDTIFVASVSHYADGRPAEVFLDVDNGSTDRAALMRDAAVLISIALQHGAPVQTLREAITRLENGVTPASPIGAALDAMEGVDA